MSSPDCVSILGQMIEENLGIQCHHWASLVSLIPSIARSDKESVFVEPVENGCEFCSPDSQTSLVTTRFTDKVLVTEMALSLDRSDPDVRADKIEGAIQGLATQHGHTVAFLGEYR